MKILLMLFCIWSAYFLGGCIASTESVQDNSDLLNKISIEMNTITLLIAKKHPKDSNIKLLKARLVELEKETEYIQAKNKNFVTKEKLEKTVRVAGQVSGKLFGYNPSELVIGIGTILTGLFATKKGLNAYSVKKRKREDALRKLDPKQADDLKDV